MTPTVTAVIPTIGRLTLARAVQSVLAQTRPVAEIIVVADTDAALHLPDDPRITVLHTTRAGSGPAHARQRGIDAATGSMIALLDDDDTWHAEKMDHQLRALDGRSENHWVLSSRISVLGPGPRRRTWPRRLIGPDEPVADYLFGFTGLTAGGAALQTSTLCFPAELAHSVRWDCHAGEPHDEPSWLIRAHRVFPDLSIIQVPEVLSTYSVDHPSVSRDRTDRSGQYIDWGLRYLADESPRVLGDYLCTSPVSAAVAARSRAGVWNSLKAGVRYGRPGICALTYAVLNGARLLGPAVRSSR